MNARLLPLLALAALATGCASTPGLPRSTPPAEAAEPDAEATTEPYRWLDPALKGTCRRVPTYGLGGGRARHGGLGAGPLATPITSGAPAP
ncbi:MAG: hypothetical protein JNK04_09745 [Myxococcales bacterium]|nr:hypothetical protein [Myxococcales bacterium]